eukprot:CAMPEP_0171463156 /NCGR_PEP_ID=MMETSP0945-20130129/6919_1 /TAXON_ID=109269 /ORGANISM="Vaucheria litorea, Strain CCMP2940" /LENGTH=117 /DNA_ID=CAMNT_0011989851 /DNA_START=237 /DNA_END=590 /DNA_ORIENTATION=+
MSQNGPGYGSSIKAKNGTKLGAMNSQGPNLYIKDNLEEVPITKLDPSLNNHQFKPYMDSGSPRIGFETFQGDSINSIQGKCIVIPFSSWQVLDDKGNVIRHVTTADPDNCVGFVPTC